MNNLDVLKHALHTMHACNHAHKSTYGIFMDVSLDLKDEFISFDILPSNMEHATQLCALLNLTLNIEANSDPSTDKTLNFFIN